MNANRKIRVLLAGPFPHAGGMGGTYGRILNNLMSSSIFREEIEFVPHRVTLPADGNFFTRYMIDIARFVRSMKNKPDILHFLMQKYKALYREYPMLKIAQAMGVKTIVDVRAGTLQYMLGRKTHRLQNAMMRDLLRNGNAIALECRKDVGFIKNQFGREGIYIPNAMLGTEFHRIQPANLVLEKDRPIRMIYSGRYSADKGLIVMLQSLDVLSRRGIKAELHLTGQGKESDVLDKIQTYVKSPPPGTRVIDHGWDVPDLYTLLAQAHIFMMPTTWPGEGHPNSVTEAMMAGLGMILCDWFHLSDIVPEKGRIIIPPRDPEALAQAILKYLNNPAELIEAGRTNRTYVEENFLDSVCYPRFLAMYQKLISR